MTHPDATTNADWFCDRFFAETRSGFGFDAMWRDYAKHLTVNDLRAAARILKIDKPAKTRAALREQFAAAWRTEVETP